MTELTESIISEPQVKEISSDSFNDYFNTIPDDKKEVLSKNGVKDTETLIKSYEGLLSLKGKKGILAPAETASDAEKTEYKSYLHKAIGVPENGEYNFDIPDGVNESTIKDDFVNKLANVSYENGISKNAFQQIINTIYPAYQEQINNYEITINEYKQRLNEGSMNTTETVKPQQETNDEMFDSLMNKAREAHSKNDFSEYQKLQKQAFTLRGY
jgi:hypothetical protein